MEKLSAIEKFLFSRFVRIILPASATIMVFLALYLVFLIAPNEQTMGAIQRVFYFHVASAVSCYLMIGFLAVGSVGYLYSRQLLWDVVARGAADVALLLASIVLVTGMIWGHSAWNTWWRWEPRLVSFLILWLILFSYQVLRSFTEHDFRQARFASVLGVLSAATIPLVIFSVKLIGRSEQLHPQVLASGGLMDVRYVQALMVAMPAMALLSIWLMLLQVTSLLLEERIKRLERSI